MSEHPLFETVDPVALDRVTQALGEAFMAAAQSILAGFADDDTIPPDAFTAGIAKAHLHRAIAIMSQAAPTPEARTLIAHDAADWIAKALEDAAAFTPANDT